MTGRKYDYSNELAQDVPQSENEERKAEARTRRLEKRSTALADEFRDLKPEIGRTYNLLCNLVEKSGVLSETILNLLELLKTALPVRLADEDKKALLDELHGIADNVVAKIRKERERMENDIHRNASRISLTPATFWCMVMAIIMLASFFACTIVANEYFIHSDLLGKLVVYMAAALLSCMVAVILVCHKLNQ